MLQSLNFVIIVFANQDLPPLKAEGDYFRILTTKEQNDTSWKIDKTLNLLNEKNEKIGTLNTSPSEADSSFYWRKRQPYLKLKDSDSGITFNFKFDVVENKKLEAKISEQCFESDIFKTRQANDLIEYIREKYNDELEFLWQKFSGNAIVRRKDNLKWYAAFLTVSKQKFGFEDSSSVEIIDLRTENIDQIVDNKTIFPGYHMNKKHWITIILDGSVSLDFIKNKIDLSYELANKNKKI